MNPAILLAFGAGAASAFSPCGVAMLPATIGFLLGSQTRDPARPMARVLRGVGAGVLLGLGFSLVVAVAAAVFSSLARVAGGLLPYVMTLLAAALVAAGILMMLDRPVIGIATGRLSERLHGIRLGFAGTLIAAGAAYGLAALSCTLPLFVALVADAAGLGVAGAVLATASFAVGVTLVLVAVAVGVALGQGAMEGALRSIQPYVPKVSGAVVIAAGLWIAYYWLMGPGHLPSM